MNEMEMNSSLAQSIMDDLFLLYLCSRGIGKHIVGYEPDGFPIISEELRTRAQIYARNTFLTLCDKFEVEMGEKWNILVEDDEG